MSAQSIAIPAGFGGFGWALARKPKWFFGAVAGALIVVLIVSTIAIRAASSVQYVTQPVVQQTLVDSITASGTVNPQNTIDVGTQVSGIISQIGVDYNSKVKKGEVLARINPTTLQAQMDQSQAQLAQAQAQAASAADSANGAASGVTVAAANGAAAKAAVASAEAGITKAQAALTLAQQTASRDSALLAQGYVAQNTVDSDVSNVAQDRSAIAAAQAAAAQAQATYDAQTASIGQSGSTSQASSASALAAQAAVESAQATVQQDRYNLSNAVITSPVDGTVIARDVSVGQTVAASLQTPTLFAIAQDLRKMEVDINVGEPDIGNVKAGDSVDFSVLAYPNQIFRGTVSQVRINPQTLNNVVTYDVVVLVDNTGGKLLPGMTANATVNVASAQNALVVPVAALQWRPATRGTKHATGTAQSPWGAVTGTAAGAPLSSGATGSVYVEERGKPVRVAVTVGLTTAAQAAVTPVQTGALVAGSDVVIGSSGAGRAAVARTSGSPLNASAGSSMRGLAH